MHPPMVFRFTLENLGRHVAPPYWFITLLFGKRLDTGLVGEKELQPYVPHDLKCESEWPKWTDRWPDEQINSLDLEILPSGLLQNVALTLVN